MFDAVPVIKETDEDFAATFGRKYHGMVENYHCEDAEYIIITLGSVCGTTRIIVDELREQGLKVGMLKIRYMRPFPEKEIQEITANAKAIGVLEKNISFGYEGTVFTNVNSAISKTQARPFMKNFVGGFGGRDITKQEIRQMFETLKEQSKPSKTVEYFNLNVATHE
jgi:pyruvate ferredoxin oxidoreductase alpha subunit